MDAGCYAVNAVRFLAGAEPEVVAAEALLSSPRVDRRMDAELRFADGRSGRVLCSLFSRTLLRISLRAVGEAGEMRVFNWVAPQLYHRLSVRTLRGRRVERVRGDASYTEQLRAFRDAVREGAPLPTDARDAVANLRVIDAIYEASGLGRRGAPAFSSSRT
jgi:predicted dehydrogenase